MKKHLSFILLLALMLSIFSTSHAVIVTIGDGTGDNIDPFNAYWGYGRSIGLYTEAQIEAFGNITSLGWSVSSSSNTAIPYKIYIMNTTDTQPAATTWNDFTTAATLVKDGTNDPYAFNSVGWHHLALDTPFTYVGGNLLIGVEANYGNSGNSSYPKFHYTYLTDTHRRWRSDRNPPTGTGLLEAFLPNLQMDIVPLSNDPVFSLNPTEHDFGSLLINDTGSRTFTIMNVGGGTLSVYDINPMSDGFFSVTDAPLFPLALATGQSTTFKIQYAPTEAGNHNATFTISYINGTADLTVSGECYDPVIYTYPFTDGFEEGQTDGQPVQIWTQYLDGGMSQYWIANSSNTGYNRAPRNGLFNATLRYGANAWLMRPFWLEAGTYYDVEVWARQDVNSGATLGIYYGTEGTVEGMLKPIVLPKPIYKGDYQQVLGSFTPETTGVHWIGINGITSYDPWYISIDDFMVKHSPTEPVFTYTPDTIDFGTAFTNAPTEFQDVIVTNSGLGTIDLTADDVSIIGADAAMFELGPNELPFTLTINQSGTIPVRYKPTTVGPHSATLRMVFESVNYDVALSGTAISEYALYESFEGETFPPEGWTVINGGDDNTWTRSTLNPRTGAAHAQIAYDWNYAHDDWLITPKLAPTATNHTFSFYGHTYGNYDERFNVLLSTTDANTESFTEVLGTNVGTGYPDYMFHTYDLSPYIGQEVYIAIQAISLNEYYLMIDDVSGPDRVPPPDIYAGEVYEALNMNGEYLSALFTSTQDLCKVPGFDGTTGPVAELNLDPDNTHIAAYTAESGIFDLTFVAGLPGTYYLMGYWDGQWHQANFWPLIVQTGDIGETVLFDIQFAAKGDVYIVFTRGFDPTVPVELSHFAATITAQNYVQITWTTQSESNITGYNIYRNDSIDLGSAIKVSEMIEGTNTSEACTYTYLDKELEQSGTYYYWLQNVEMDGYTSYHGPVSVTFTAEDGGGTPDIPFVTKLENAYPNPFNPNTNIRYQLKEAGDVKIDIFNARGQLVRSFSRTHDAAGYYQINWDGRDSSGKAVSSGVYQYRMSSGKYRSTKKMVLKK